MESKKVKPKYIHVKTASYFQPFDVSVNSPFKYAMRDEWNEWYANRPKEYTAKGYRRRTSYKWLLKIVSNACIMSHNVTLWNHISCIIEHLITDLAEGPTPQQPNGKFLRLDLSISCNFQLTSHVQNTHGPHTINPHSDSSYPNIFRLPTWSTFQNAHIYRSTSHRIMVQVEGL